MAKKILAFGASSSKKSINKQFATYAANQVAGGEVNLVDLNDFEMPIYSIDRELENGFPEEVKQFAKHIEEADGIVVSFAEHNGCYSAAFKNIFDWTSRYQKGVWLDRPMLLLSTSPGPRGAKTILEIAANKFKFMNKNTLAAFSLPSFGQNFSEEGIKDAELAAAFKAQLEIFTKAMETVVAS